MKYLFYDTETTGLIPKGVKELTDILAKYPHIVQLSYILYCDETHTIIENHDHIIYLSDDIELSEKSVEIHGISREISQTKGIQLSEALNTFKNVYEQCDVLIAHNMEFDLQMIKVASLRCENYSLLNMMDSKTKYCTMRNSINLCNIEAKNRLGKYKKYPTQTELHVKLFDCVPKNLHNSFNDILVCIRCYFKMTQDIDLKEKNDTLKKLFIELLNV